MRRFGLLFALITLPAACSDSRRAEAGGDHSPAALIAKGESLYQAEKYDSAQIVFSEATAASERTHDEENLARSLTWLGLVTGRLGDAPEAEQLGRKALELKKRIGLDREMPFSYHSIGLALLDMDRNEEAKQLFGLALESATRSKDTRFVSKAYGGLGLANAYLGNLRESRENQRASRLAARTANDDRLEANAFANEAMVDIYEGNALPAIALLDSARAIYKKSGYSAGEQNALGQLATAYELTGREDLALATLDSSLALSRKLKLAEQEADLLRLIGGVNLRLGNYREALSTFLQADSMMRRAGLHANLGSTVRGEAEARLRLGDIPGSKRAIDEALKHHNQSGELLEQLDDVVLASEIEFKAAGPRNAYRFVTQARRLADSINTRGARITAIVAEAHIADLAGDSKRVIDVLNSLSADFAAGDVGVEWIANALKSRAYGRLGMLDSARTSGSRAVEAVDRLRGNLASEALRSTYVADRADVYGDLVVTLLRLGRAEEAFRVADAARSRALLEHLASTRGERNSGGAPPELIEEERLLKRIDDLVQKLRAGNPAKPGERGGESAASLSKEDIELAEARREFEGVAARGAQLRRPSTTILGANDTRSAEVRRSLDRNEALIEYMLLPDRILAFVITQDTMRITSSGLQPQVLVQRIRLLSDIWGRNTERWTLGVPASRELFRTLITPLMRDGNLRNIERLVIVPHGVLAGLPFAALINGSTGRFLVEDFSIVNLPSAAAFTALRSRSATRLRGTQAGTGFAPFNRRSQLPATMAEVTAFKSAALDRNIVAGANATEAALRTALSDNRIVHVATHGVMNYRSPLFSRVEVAPGPMSKSDDNGRLEVYEVLDLSVRSPLVFLSGCETGAGTEWLNDPVRGTADLTLTQAFLAAGARNVITTLWRIADQGAARFAETFYSNLKTRPLADAFATTQRTMSRDPQYQNPYYWAGYILAGEGQLGVEPQKDRTASVSVTSGTKSNVGLTRRYEP